MTRRSRILLALLLAVGLPLEVAAEVEREGDSLGTTWGVEVRLQAGAIDDQSALGRTGPPLESRFSFDSAVAPGLHLFGEFGTGDDAVVDENGLHRLFVEYRFSRSNDLSASAGWIRVPFGRWDTLTVSRSLVKDRVFHALSESSFQLRRESPGIGVRGAPGLFEFDLALVDRATNADFALTTDAGRDFSGRVGIRRGGVSFGVSVLEGLSEGKLSADLGNVDLAAVSAYGFDAEWSSGFLTVGGEYVVLSIDGRRSEGYYAQAAYDLSAWVRGLRLVSKYDVLEEASLLAAVKHRRATLGGRLAVRRDLDIQFEYDLDRSSFPDAEHRDSHLVLGLVYRF